MRNASFYSISLKNLKSHAVIVKPGTISQHELKIVLERAMGLEYHTSMVRKNIKRLVRVF